MLTEIWQGISKGFADTVNTVYDITSGDIIIDGYNVKDNPMECKKIVAFIPDNPDIYENMTGAQYLNFISDVYNLTKEETDSIFKTINKFIQLGNSNEFSKIIGDIFINVLIGNESNAGLAYSLKDAGATDFSFETDGTNNYFVIEM